jgi:diacylglycerol kinase (ATP)
VRQFLLIVNRTAGKGKAHLLAAHAAHLLRQRGHGVRIAVASSPAQVKGLIASCDAGVRVICCGGDGTVHGLIGACVQRGLVMGVLPAGTGDDIARTLGVHAFSVADHVDLWEQSDPVAVDLGYIEPYNEYFLGVLSAGFDSRVNERANRRPGGKWRYVVAMIGEIGGLRPVRYQVAHDGVTDAWDGLLVCVGNGRTYGSGMAVCPMADCRDGYLDVTWVGGVSIRRFLRLFPQVYSGTHVQQLEVRTLRVQSIDIDAPDQIAYADGERIGPLPIRVSVRPGALQVFGQPVAA